MRSLLLAVFMAFIFLSCNSNDPGGGLVGWNDPYAGSEILVTNEQGEILGVTVFEIRHIKSNIEVRL